MAETTENAVGPETSIATELNDLLRLEHDAARAYALAGARLADPRNRAAVERFAEDHERHADELTRLVRGHGMRPLDARATPPGRFELAVRAAVFERGDDRQVLRAVKASERVSRDQYRRIAQRMNGPEVAAVLRRAASDEAAHYAWALEALDDLESARVPRRVERVLGAASTAFATASHRIEARTDLLLDVARRHLTGEIGAHPLRTTLMAVGLGVVAAAVSGTRAADAARA